MSSKPNQNVKSEVVKDFGERLKEAFNERSNADIARALGVSDSAVTLYVKGRVPSAVKLIEISNLTGCNLHWLLTGTGEKKIKIDKSITASLVFQGGKGGVGTSTAAMLSAVVLANKGYPTLLVGNGLSADSFLFSLTINADRDCSGEDAKKAESDIYLSTSIQNLDIFIKKGERYNAYFVKQVKSFEKNEFEVRRDYRFIVFDVFGFPNTFSKGDYGLESFLAEGKLVIPYETSNSMIETVDKILGSLSLGGFLSASPFLGLFVNKESKDSTVRKLYETKKKRIQEVIGSKMFKTIVRSNAETIEDFIVNTDIEKLKKTQLFDDFSNLVDEIFDRLQLNDS